MREGNDEMTYFLLFRHAHLALANLASHPEYRKQSPEIKALEKEVSQNLKTLEVLKPRIERRYEEYVKVAEARQARRDSESAKRNASLDTLYPNEGRGPGPGAPEQLRGQEHADIAARLADQEFSRRASSRRSHPTGLSQQNERDDLAARMRAIRVKVEPQHTERSREEREERTPHPSNTAGFNYPTVPIAHKSQQRQSEPITSRQNQYEPTRAPLPPPKQTRPDYQAPPRPQKEAAPPSIPGKVSSEPSYSFAPGAKLENGTSLRTIFIPPTLRTTFLRLAHQNTLKNVETCGFLAGTLRANALFVSALVVPKQTATSDTCEMTDESELFDYVDQHDLMILGWIHTHPTQTCFMSSRDLHTHSGYQMMLAESVAIVCAPSKGDTGHGGDWGVYRLTDPPGKMAILQCEKPGIFHQHDVDNLYTDAMRPGHVMEISGMDFDIVDLR